jgi:signal transduction histidine kinase
MIADLMLFARPPQLRIADFDLWQMLARVVDEWGEMASERGIRLELEPGGEPLVIAADEMQLAVAIGAVVKNAIEAVGVNGCVQVLAARITGDAGAGVEIVVRDNGPGISENVRAHLFDPFFSGREAGRGLGFGLSKCWRIVTEHGGGVHVDSPCGCGAEFVLTLPERAVAA